MMLSGCLITVIPLALAIGYMKFDPKIMPYLGIWAVNNLVFVAFAGEVLFRGMLRGACLPIRTIGAGTRPLQSQSARSCSACCTIRAA